MNPVDAYRSHLTGLLANLTEAPQDAVRSALQTVSLLSKGDLLLAVPALRMKGANPEQLAQKIQRELPDSLLFQRPLADRVFVQFFFKPIPLATSLLPLILQNQKSYGYDLSLGGQKKVVVEFGSPNIAKPFHAGHLRSTIIGGFLANLYEGAGWHVTRLNYLGDWGKQYGVLGVGFQKFGNKVELEKDPIGHLFRVYVQISTIAREEKSNIQELEGLIATMKASGEDTTQQEEDLAQRKDQTVDECAREYFKAMCNGDSAALGLWREFRDLSIVRYKETFARLNIKYDEYDGESQIEDSSMETAARTLEERGLSQDSDGAKIVDLSAYRLGRAIVRKKDGTSIYLTRDIGAVFERFEKYQYDKMIYVIASQQDLHMMQLIKIIELMGRKDLSDRLQHINFGLVAGMSTRRGTVKFLDDILRDCADKMHEVMRSNEKKYDLVQDPERIADILGISAVLVQDMSGKRINNYTFDMDRMTSFEGDTGPYLQYSHARLCSIIEKAGDASTDQLLEADFSLLSEQHAVNLIRTLAQWPDVFRNTYKTQEPVTVLTYLFRLTHALNASYDHLNILKSEERTKLARLALYTSVKVTLSIGMKLLGLTPVNRM